MDEITKAVTAGFHGKRSAHSVYKELRDRGLSISYNTVNLRYKKLADPSSYTTAAKVYRPRNLTEADIAQCKIELERSLGMDNTLTLEQLTVDLLYKGQNVSLYNVRRILEEGGFKRFNVKYSHFVRQENRQPRVCCGLRKQY